MISCSLLERSNWLIMSSQWDFSTAFWITASGRWLPKNLEESEEQHSLTAGTCWWLKTYNRFKLLFHDTLPIFCFSVKHKQPLLLWVCFIVSKLHWEGKKEVTAVSGFVPVFLGDNIPSVFLPWARLQGWFSALYLKEKWNTIFVLVFINITT